MYNQPFKSKICHLAIENSPLISGDKNRGSESRHQNHLVQPDCQAPPAEFLNYYVLGPENLHFQQIPCDRDAVWQGPHFENHWAGQIEDSIIKSFREEREGDDAA